MDSYGKIVSSSQRLSELFLSNGAMKKEYDDCSDPRKDIQTNCGIDPCFCYINQNSWGEFFQTLTPEYEEPVFGTGIGGGKWKIPDKAPLLFLVSGWVLKETGENLLSDETMSLLDIILNDGLLSSHKSMEDVEKMFKPEIDSERTSYRTMDQLTAGLQGMSTSESVENTFDEMTI